MDVRASDPERDSTVEQLREAAADGRLTLEELTDRIEAASNAVMRSELVPLTAELPVVVWRSHSEPAEIRKVGDIKRKGVGRLGRVPLRSYFRAVIVDLPESTITAQELAVADKAVNRDAHRLDQHGLHGRVKLLLGHGGQGIGALRLGGRHS